MPPPIRGHTGGLNFQSIFFTIKCFLRAFILCSSSAEAPTKFVPFSDLMTLTVLLLAKNCLRERIKEYVDKLPAIWGLAALVDRHVNKTMKCFAVA